MRSLTIITTLALVGSLATACQSADASPEGAMTAETAPTLATSAQELPTVLVYKSPTCGCCSGWVEHLESEGFTVDARDVPNVVTVKQEAGVPTSMFSCHTAIVDGYVVEGHVPAEHVKQLLADRPDVAGIAVPAMPIGSPGMEGPNPEPYQVLSFTHDGRTAVYADVDPR